MEKSDGSSNNLDIQTEFKNVKESVASEEEVPFSFFISNKDIKKVGDRIRSCNKSSEKYSEALFKLKQYRQNHALALEKFIPLLAKKLERLGLAERSIISSRVKRLESIIIKLNRLPKMQLSRMDDLAGVRVVLSTIEDLQKFIDDNDVCEISNADFIGETIKTNDRIEEPKSDGYRSVHKVFKCEIIEGKTVRIELQIRTKIQHEWATMVEVLGSVEGTSFKTGNGSEQYKRFLLLASVLFAKSERKPVSSNCKKLTDLQLYKELDHLNSEVC